MYTVYSKDNCPMCDKAKSLLTSKQQDFQVVKIVADELATSTNESEIGRTAFMEKFPGIRVVPYIVFGDETFKTFHELDKHLN